MNEVNCIAGARAIDAIRKKRSLHPTGYGPADDVASSNYPVFKGPATL
jgi:hypothetical protein